MTVDKPLRTLEAFETLDVCLKNLGPYLNPAVLLPTEASLFGRLLTSIQRTAPLIVSSRRASRYLLP